MSRQQRIFDLPDKDKREDRRTSVGKSNRTPGKHQALDKYLGKTAGVISKRFRRSRVFFVDCTAGDGSAEDFGRHTSPGIMLRHAEWLRNQGMQVEVLLFERSAMNAARLQERIGNRALVHATSSAEMEPIFFRSSDVVFVSNDPNTIADWALPDALKSAPPLTTVFSTLGCNVGGLKRLPLEQRQVWYAHIRDQTNLLQEWHDAMLCSLMGDASQWAYLVNHPKKWRIEMQETFASAFKKVGYETKTNWLKEDRKKFSDAVDQLFLTRGEYNDKSV